MTSRVGFGVVVGLGVTALRIRVRLVGVGAVDDVGGDMLMDEAGDDANDDDTGEEEADQDEGRDSGRQTGSREVLFGGGEHAVERGE